MLDKLLVSHLVKVDPLGRNDSLWFKVRFWTHVLTYRLLVQPFRHYHWRPYDPSWLVALARAQLPNEPWLPDALARCTTASGDIPQIHFVNPRRPNRSGSEWQFERNLTLEDPKHGELTLDVLKGNRVGGIEFLDVLLRDG